MCFILLLAQMDERYPLIVAANRDEARSRPSTPPHRWAESPAIWAGKDEVAGGTWLGVNQAGVLAAVTNRRTRNPDPSLPSRGNLCLGVLRRGSLAEASAFVDEQLAASRYNPFNLLCATTDGAWVRTWRGGTQKLQPGIHVITNEGDVDDAEQPMLAHGQALAGQLQLSSGTPLDELHQQLARICTDTEAPARICRPDGERGTVSSSIIALNAQGGIAAYWHAVGPPCTRPYAPIDLSTG